MSRRALHFICGTAVLFAKHDWQYPLPSVGIIRPLPKSCVRMPATENPMNFKLRFASGVSVLLTTLAFGHIMIKDTQGMVSHHDEGQLFIVVHTIIAIALGVLSLTGAFSLLATRHRQNSN